MAFRLCSCAVVKVDLMSHCEKEGMKVYSKLAALPGNHERLTNELEDFLNMGWACVQICLVRSCVEEFF